MFFVNVAGIYHFLLTEPLSHTGIFITIYNEKAIKASRPHVVCLMVKHKAAIISTFCYTQRIKITVTVCATWGVFDNKDISGAFK